MGAEVKLYSLHEHLGRGSVQRAHDRVCGAAIGGEVDGNAGRGEGLSRMPQTHQTAEQSDDQGDAAPRCVQKRGHVLVPLRGCGVTVMPAPG